MYLLDICTLILIGRTEKVSVMLSSPSWSTCRSFEMGKYMNRELTELKYTVKENVDNRLSTTTDNHRMPNNLCFFFFLKNSIFLLRT